jgi:hydroxyacylglutathione hydrolase
MLVRQIFDPKLAQYAYLVGCPATGEALIIDPERDIDQYIDLAEENELEITAVVDTHIHADYLTGMREFAERGVKVYASDEGDADWKYEWLLDSDYDYELLTDGDTFMVGNIEIEAVHSPGHTPEHLSYIITDHGSGADEPIAVATGDFVFVGDLGRPDLLETAAGLEGTMVEGAKVLYDSVERFKKEMPEFLQVWPAHGAGSACGKALGDIPLSTVGYELRNNASIQASDTEDNFVDFILSGQPEPPMYFARMKRDNKIGPAVLGGHLPQPKKLMVKELKALANSTDVAVVDTRLDRSSFMHGHLPGSIYAPLNKTFPTITGSFIEEDTPIVLITEEDNVEEAVRDLVRIGLDNVEGFATPDMLDQIDDLARTPELDFSAMKQRMEDSDALVFDVRGISEYEEGHVPGAANLAHTRLFVRQDEVPKDKTLLVHCQSGARAAAASSLLERFGHKVEYVNDLFENWEQMGEVARGKEEAATAA